MKSKAHALYKTCTFDILVLNSSKKMKYIQIKYDFAYDKKKSMRN